MSAARVSAAQQPAGPASGVRPRLVVYDVVDLPALVETLRELYPQHHVLAASEWPMATMVDDSAIPVWYIRQTGAELLTQSGALIRNLAYPLAMSNRWYVVAFAAARSALAPGEIDLKSPQRLDLEDLWRLLTHDAAAELHFSELADLATQTPLTPIEERLASALMRAGIAAQPQVRFGPYIVDFLVGSNGKRFAVEADGAAFHDAVRDGARDAQLKSQMGLAKVVRFTGSQIYRDADACAQYVAALLSDSLSSRHGSSTPRRQTLDTS
jgi:very-short-patch-repair endonuclease